MENATKALIIAAAVLVAIIIISLTLGVVNQGREAMQGADMSEAEKSTFNQKFIAYEGNAVSASDVNALLNQVLTHNQNEIQKNGNNAMTVAIAGNAGAGVDNAAGTISRVPNGYYTVQCVLADGIVTTINVDPN